MKIQSIGNTGYSIAVHEKKERGDSQRKHSETGDLGNEGSFSDELEEEEKKLSQALEDFEAESQEQSHGLHASVLGSGPGLKVVLKDPSGKVIRQLSSQEFLKIRESSHPHEKAAGKILDQKF